MIVDTERLRKSAFAIYVLAEEDIAKDISEQLLKAADEIDKLRNLKSYLNWKLTNKKL